MFLYFPQYLTYSLVPSILKGYSAGLFVKQLLILSTLNCDCKQSEMHWLYLTSI